MVGNTERPSGGEGEGDGRGRFASGVSFLRRADGVPCGAERNSRTLCAHRCRATALCFEMVADDFDRAIPGTVVRRAKIFIGPCAPKVVRKKVVRKGGRETTGRSAKLLELADTRVWCGAMQYPAA